MPVIAHSLVKAARHVEVPDDYASCSSDFDIVETLLAFCWECYFESKGLDKVLSVLVHLLELSPLLSVRWLMHLTKRYRTGASINDDVTGRFLPYRTAMEKIGVTSLAERLSADVQAIQENQPELCFGTLALLFQALPDICTGHEELVHAFVATMDPSQLFSTACDLVAGSWRVFGDACQPVLSEMLGWDTIEQNNSWQLLGAELVQHAEAAGAVITHLVDIIDPEANQDAFAGVLSLLRSLQPNSQLLRAIITPSDSSDPRRRFALCALMQWNALHSGELRDALKQLLEENTRWCSGDAGKAAEDDEEKSKEGAALDDDEADTAEVQERGRQSDRTLLYTLESWRDSSKATVDGLLSAQRVVRQARLWIKRIDALDHPIADALWKGGAPKPTSGAATPVSDSKSGQDALDVLAGGKMARHRRKKNDLFDSEGSSSSSAEEEEEEEEETSSAEETVRAKPGRRHRNRANDGESSEEEAVDSKQRQRRSTRATAAVEKRKDKQAKSPAKANTHAKTAANRGGRTTTRAARNGTKTGKRATVTTTSSSETDAMDEDEEEASEDEEVEEDEDEATDVGDATDEEEAENSLEEDEEESDEEGEDDAEKAGTVKGRTRAARQATRSKATPTKQRSTGRTAAGRQTSAASKRSSQTSSRTKKRRIVEDSD
ncbi:hypothetical protein THASP1DRAFT_32512 [Thamnocephalis sphaerospora]|uniref:Ints3-like C-terminal domain-containing protein n=1 Tax=Thamnocephalis sphaerospora TaxID=78915 RepID=A0A4P9XIV3_9FUNG|nr:hypothetical protein THASP1DRAFT_32512 [Thamnocephalis sphaerospora]|eukprot:RKP05655.1 hypothetical protein THASP1DRAFT_32512 [Thamnocephalis sphaerospora]